MIIYEVNLTIQPDIYEPYRLWLDEHMLQVLEFPGFQSARVYKHKVENSVHKHLCVHYHIAKLTDLEHYLKNHASRLRQMALDQFGDKFQATRRVLEPL